MQVFSSRSIKRCFAVPAARFIYATADQLVVAEIDQLHLIGGCDAVLIPHKPAERIPVLPRPGMY
jgi:hypothetical protein